MTFFNPKIMWLFDWEPLMKAAYKAFGWALQGKDICPTKWRRRHSPNQKFEWWPELSVKVSFDFDSCIIVNQIKFTNDCTKNNTNRNNSQKNRFIFDKIYLLLVKGWIRLRRVIIFLNSFPKFHFLTIDLNFLCRL